MNDKPVPKVKHSTKTKDLARIRKILKHFAGEIGQRLASADSLPAGLFDSTGQGLLRDRSKLKDLRGELVEVIKNGMLARKDLELEIGLWAAIVWYNRLEKEKQDHMEEWG